MVWCCERRAVSLLVSSSTHSGGGMDIHSLQFLLCYLSCLLSYKRPVAGSWPFQLEQHLGDRWLIEVVDASIVNWICVHTNKVVVRQPAPVRVSGKLMKQGGWSSLTILFCRLRRRKKYTLALALSLNFPSSLNCGAWKTVRLNVLKCA